MREFELESYKKLCDKLDIPILAAECSDGSHWNAAEFIRRDACDIMARIRWVYRRYNRPCRRSME